MMLLMVFGGIMMLAMPYLIVSERSRYQLLYRLKLFTEQHGP